MGIWVDPAQRVEFVRRLSTHGTVQNFEVNFRTKKADVRVVLLSAELIEINGERCVLSVSEDITERKRAEEAISSVNQKLIEAHEEERTRIARELHDDIGQRLALLAMNLGRLKPDTSRAEVQEGIRKAIEEVSNLGTDMRDMSHRLHSSHLEHLGLVAAASAYCSERSEQHKVEIDFHSEDIPKDLSREVSLCLFRVLQEALQNAIKHSRSRRSDVSFSRTVNGMICLTVHDSGIGYPVEATKGRGLGLISMKERLNLVGGALSIESQPGKGTTIRASVPLIPRAKSTRAE
jgi:signal transduction histidine kinase